MSNFRRRLLINKTEYITNGLVFNLVANDFNNDTKVWKERVNGFEFKPYNSSKSPILDKGGVLFNNSPLIVENTKMSAKNNSSTIEVVYSKGKENSSSSYGMLGQPNGNIIFAYDNGGFVYKPTISGYRWKSELFKLGEINTVSISDAKESSLNGNKNTWFTKLWNCGESDANSIVVGGINHGKYEAVGIYVYAIRIYDRFLSLEEQQHNAKCDMALYNFGEIIA